MAIISLCVHTALCLYCISSFTTTLVILPLYATHLSSLTWLILIAYCCCTFIYDISQRRRHVSVEKSATSSFSSIAASETLEAIFKQMTHSLWIMFISQCLFFCASVLAAMGVLEFWVFDSSLRLGESAGSMFIWMLHVNMNTAPLALVQFLLLFDSKRVHYPVWQYGSTLFILIIYMGIVALLHSLQVRPLSSPYPVLEAHRYGLGSPWNVFCPVSLAVVTCIFVSSAFHLEVVGIQFMSSWWSTFQSSRSETSLNYVMRTVRQRQQKLDRIQSYRPSMIF